MPNNEKNAEPAVRDAQSTACLLYASDAADD